MSQRSPFQRFLGELRRRHVPQTAAVYLVAAWAAIEVADVIVPNLNGPSWVVTAVIVAAGVGLPGVLILAWIFDWGPEGIQRTPSDPVDEDAMGAAEAAGTPPTAGMSPTSAPWMAALAVLVVAIGSALVVAALVTGDGDAGGEPAGERGDAAASESPELVPSPGVDTDAIRRGVMEGMRGLDDVPGLDRLDSMDTSELIDFARTVAEEAGLGVLIQEPEEWRLGLRVPVALAAGDTLEVEGLAQDTMGVVAVTVDGQTVATVDEPEPMLRFTARVVGTGSVGRRGIEIVVRTADGREVSRTYDVIQRPGS